MTYNYLLSNFLTISTGDNSRIIIKDKHGNFNYSIILDISHFFVKNNYVVIKMTNENDIQLSFESRDVAQQALDKLEMIRKTLLSQTGELVQDERPTYNTLNTQMVANDTTISIIPTVTGSSFTIITGSWSGVTTWLISGSTSGVTALSNYTTGVTYYDYRLATNTPVLQKPKSRIKVSVNGVIVYSSGQWSIQSCYFSPNGDPTLARINDGDVQVGDNLYWIEEWAQTSGFNLTTTDRLDYDYLT